MKVGDLVKWKTVIPELQRQIGVVMGVGEVDAKTHVIDPPLMVTALDIFWNNGQTTNTTIDNVEVVNESR